VKSLPASPPLARALAERNYHDATPVQSAVLAPEAIGRDLLVSAQTGSGKTVAYGLAIANDMMGEAERLPRAASPLALIVAPTRELALQVHRELEWLYAYAGARVVSCVGAWTRSARSANWKPVRTSWSARRDAFAITSAASVSTSPS
jgi:ATP-dependent RNA helicase DeaD